MAITAEQQAAVWAIPETELSDNAKQCYGVMADHTDELYAQPGAAATISAQLGNSLTEAEAEAALNELYQYGLLSIQGIQPQYPAVPPSPT
jgi:hypothetical protein